MLINITITLSSNNYFRYLYLNNEDVILSSYDVVINITITKMLDVFWGFCLEIFKTAMKNLSICIKFLVKMFTNNQNIGQTHIKFKNGIEVRAYPLGSDGGV